MILFTTGWKDPFWYKPGPRHNFTAFGFAPVQFLALCSFCPSHTPLKQPLPPPYLLLVFTSSFTESFKKSPGSPFHREVALSPILSKRPEGRCCGGRTCCQRWLGPGAPALLSVGKCNVVPHSPPKPALNLNGPSQAPEENNNKSLYYWQFKEIAGWRNNTKIIKVLSFVFLA